MFTVVPQLLDCLNCAGFTPPRATDVMARGAVPVFVRVNPYALVCPTMTFPKL